MKRHTTVFWIFIAMALLIAGCAAGPRSGSSAFTYVTLLTEERAPLNFTEDGRITGQAAEVVRTLQSRTGTRGRIRILPWDEAYKRALERPDTALFATVMTKERKGRFQWVGPVTAMEVDLYARKGSEITVKTLEEAKKVGTIATIRDYATEQMLKKEGFENLQSHPDEESAARALLQGKADLFFSSKMTIADVLRNVGADMKDVQSVFTVSSDFAYIAFSKATPPDLVARWQAELDAMKRDGSFNAIYAEWFPGQTPPGIYQMMTEEYPPITYLKNGQPSGFVTDMVREIASRLHVPDNIRLTSWKNAYNTALLHPNVILFSAERTPEREALFHWVGPVGKNDAVLYAKKGSGIRINSLEEAKRVGAIATTTDWFTEQRLKREGFTNLVSSSDPEDNVRQLMNGEVQLSIFTDLTVPEIVKNAGYSMADLEPVNTVSRTYFYIALSKGTPMETVRAGQAALDDLKKEGTFETIYRRYLPDADLDDLLP
ncbi:MAG: transporter substrate-binding domain-containing protein [Campylobacterales bacterium]